MRQNVESSRSLSIWGGGGGSFVTLVAYISEIKKLFTALMDLTDM